MTLVGSLERLPLVAGLASPRRSRRLRGRRAPPRATAGPPKANPCDGSEELQTVAGPWVAVPASGEAEFLLECPKRAGTIGGTDALVELEGRPRRVGGESREARFARARTTDYFAFFRAGSAKGRAGLFQPYIGCIPQQKVNPRSTVSAPDHEAGVTPGRVPRSSADAARPQGRRSRRPRRTARRASASSAAGTRSCSAPPRPPDPALANKVHVALTIAKGKVLAAIQTDAGMPPAAQAELQVGAVCAK